MRELSDVLDELRAAQRIRLVWEDMSDWDQVGLHADGACLPWARLTVVDSRLMDQRRINVADAHEYGHHQHLTADLFTVPPLLAQKQEALAERTAAGVFLSGCETYDDFAAALDITRDAFLEWLAIMQRRYGSGLVRTGRHAIRFWPLPVHVYEMREDLKRE